MLQTEILAPAGSPESLAAALDAGADAVYFGLKKLNARQGAANFLPSRLQETMALIHSRGAKAYLTLNIDLSQRELGEAARTLELARQCKVDAVLIKDPALLAMKPYFPDLIFHFSTQAGISASPGVCAAHALGISRVVLARELSREEIISCCQVPEMEIEVFVQGAMCFSCSGRCLLSSWIGGRSGNRGACASPCRFCWSSSGLPENSRPFSMHDLCLLEHVSELSQAGVCSLKIEGRLKSPGWVHDAVQLYRNALADKHSAADLMEQARTLGSYTGRQLTDAYFRKQRRHLTGEAARPAASPGLSACSLSSPPADSTNSSAKTASEGISADFTSDAKDALLITWRYGSDKSTLRIPPQRIANARRALRLDEIFARIPRESEKFSLTIEIPPVFQGKLLPKRCSSLIEDHLNEFIRNLNKEEDGNVRVKISAELRNLVSPKQIHGNANRLHPGDSIQFIRLGIEEAPLLKQTAEECRIFFAWHPGEEALETSQFHWLEQNQARIYAVALPQVCYEHELPAWNRLLQFCGKHQFTVEINSWEGWELARRKHLAIIGGPGMAVLNSLAADFLHQAGCQEVSVSPEIDRTQLEDLCSCTDVPLFLTIFGRPLLFQTRVQDSVPLNSTVEDHKKIRMTSRKTGELIQFRPETPMDWRTVRNSRISIRGMIADFCGSPDPAADWKNPPSLNRPFLFNYDRQLR